MDGSASPSDLTRAVDHGEVIFIAVGTPPRKDGSADLSFVQEVGRGIAGKMASYKVIVTKSTVPVGTGALLQQVIADGQSKKIAFDVVSNPEFLREGSAIEDFMRPNRVVIGSDSERAVAVMKDLYRPLYLIETPFVVTDVATAEMIKYASNAFLATKISFINEIATLCERVGSGRSNGCKRHGPGPPDRLEISPCGTRLWRVLFSEGSGRARANGRSRRLSHANSRSRRFRQRPTTQPHGKKDQRRARADYRA